MPSSGGMLAGLRRRGGTSATQETPQARRGRLFAEVNSLISNVQAQRLANPSGALANCETELFNMQGQISAAMLVGDPLPGDISHRIAHQREQLGALQELALDSEVVHHSGELDTNQYWNDRPMDYSGELDPAHHLEGR
ncbi:hypothetical protein [Acidovorax sp. NCPPB 4044]|uniref:hypothetical protein n=1 Tax=Acidovorax sp. NCPPB 4044 TaxID=2940490 RepID=UPI00230394DD|nr:hypothetical protein [Acidovorax sp. NCPPB 4044]MDA8519752.1 hypothetical protein [Acidovorax sp. NCPPB 4044]